MILRVAMILAVGLLSGCQNPVRPASAVLPADLSDAQVWMAQGHWIQAMDVLETLSYETPEDPGVWRALGEVHWRLGVEAMASFAALDPNSAGLESLANHVFQLEEWLDENATRYNACRVYADAPFAGALDGRSDPGIMDLGDTQ